MDNKNSMKKIVAFCGVIGSGKDYRAKEFVSNGYKLINFAEPLKKIILKTLKIKNDSPQNYELFKETYWNSIGNFPSFSGRELLQLGNVARKILHEDIWINAWENSIKNFERIVVSDCRYLNEGKKIVSLGGEIFFCDFRSMRYNSKTKYESEQMAQDLIKIGYKHGDKINEYFINKIDEVI